MEQYSNPFAIRASEKIESDETFIQLFSSEPLTHLERLHGMSKLWNNVTYIQSSPGGGKTTLLRLFSPSVLRKIIDRNRELYNKLKKLQVKENNEILKCGAYLQIGRDYAFLEDDDIFNKIEQKRIFFALLNARIVLISLKSLMILAGLNYRELDQIKYCPGEHFAEMASLPHTCTGKDLLTWASKLERGICQILDNYEKTDNLLTGHNTLFALSAMNAQWFTFNGHHLCQELIFQLDDAHKFTECQKQLLRAEAIEKRIHATLWIAERLESLTSSEILADNNFQDRDYQELRLDESKSMTKSTFISMAKTIASRRSKYSLANIELMETLANDSYEYKSLIYRKVTDKYLKKIEKNEAINQYVEWLNAIKAKQSDREKALYLRAMLMFLARKKDSFDLYQLFPHEVEEMEGTLAPLLPLAEEIIPGEANATQYFGNQNLIDLASFNVEQFLNFSSLFYERLIAKKIINSMQYDLTAEEQHEIITEECMHKKDEIKNLPRGNILLNFIQNILDFCKKETFTDSFSYRTVTGFAINEENQAFHGNDGFWFQEETNNSLAEILRDCLAFNLLERTGTIQGTKGQKWTVFYLNRWLCVCANLSLNRGGWRKIPLAELKKWIKK